jgi:hypothetical protein
LYQGFQRVLVITLQVLSQLFNVLTVALVPAFNALPAQTKGSFESRLGLVTAMIKRNPAREGHYAFDDTRPQKASEPVKLELAFLEDDVAVADPALKECLKVMGRVTRLSPWTRVVRAIGINFPTEDDSGSVHQQE